MKPSRDIDCESAKALIDLAVTGDLDDEEEARLRAHNARCRACAKRLSTRRALWEHYPAGIHPTDELLARTLGGLAKRPAISPVRGMNALHRTAAAVAAAVLLVAGVLFYLRQFSLKGPADEDGASARREVAVVDEPGRTPDAPPPSDIHLAEWIY